MEMLGNWKVQIQIDAFLPSSAHVAQATFAKEPFQSQ